MKVLFQKSPYEVVFTDHALLQMGLRDLDQAIILDVIATGKVKAKEAESKFWAYKEIAGRKDNLISVSISIESPHLIVITTMINWRPL